MANNDGIIDEWKEEHGQYDYDRAYGKSDESKIEKNNCETEKSEEEEYSI